MINRGFNSTKDSIDVIRNEVEVERLELLTQSQLIEQQKSELAFEQTKLATEKSEFEKNGARTVAATAGQALLVETEVKKRMKEEKDREEYERKAREAGGVDHDLRAL